MLNTDLVFAHYLQCKHVIYFRILGRKGESVWCLRCDAASIVEAIERTTTERIAS